MHLPYTALVTALSLVVYFVLTGIAGRARGTYKIEAPATTGNPAFERIFRVQQNTLESLIMYLPALWLFAAYVSDRWAAALGAVWIVARILYARGYYEEAKKRGPGVIVSTLATAILILGSLIGVGITLFK